MRQDIERQNTEIVDLCIKIEGKDENDVLEELKTIIFHLECGSVPGLTIGKCYSEVTVVKSIKEKQVISKLYLL